MHDERSFRLAICYVFIDPIGRRVSHIAARIVADMARIVGEDVVVHVLYAGHLDVAILEPLGVRCHRCSTSFPRIPLVEHVALARRVRKLAHEEGVLLFMNTWKHYGLLPVAMGAGRAGASTLARVAGVPIRGGSRRPLRRLRHWAGRKLENASLRAADHVHVISEYLREVYAERGVPRSKITVVSAGCDTRLFRPAKPAERRGQYGHLLFVGRLVRSKGVGVLLRAVKMLVEQRDSGIRCVVAGAGPESERFKQDARDLEIGHLVEFAGHVDSEDLAELYRSASMLILPSREEGLGKVVLEAQASGIPVIGTAVGALKELLAEGRGILVDPGDPRALASAIHELLRDPEQCRLLGDKGREYVLAEHSFDVIRPRYMSLFRKLTGCDR